jgi:branched-chain amino acid transport system ATP-binding protein
MTEEGLLEAKQVHAYYGPVPALVNLSFLVRAGEIVTLLGANGAGKTTTLRTIYGVLPAVRGDIFFAGHSIKGWAPQKLVGLGICYVPEGAKVFAPMTVLDNLILGSYCRRKRANKEAIGRDLSMVHALFPVLQKFHGRLAGTLSGGEQQMLALARALMSSPKLLLLDEPSLGLAPMLITEVMRLIGRLREQGLSVLLAEQNARSALRIADRGYVMERGRITIEGTTEELLSNENVRVAYIGSKTLRNMQERDPERKRMAD